MSEGGMSAAGRAMQNELFSDILSAMECAREVLRGVYALGRKIGPIHSSSNGAVLALSQAIELISASRTESLPVATVMSSGASDESGRWFLDAICAPGRTVKAGDQLYVSPRANRATQMLGKVLQDGYLSDTMTRRIREFLDIPPQPVENLDGVRPPHARGAKAAYLPLPAPGAAAWPGCSAVARPPEGTAATDRRSTLAEVSRRVADRGVAGAILVSDVQAIISDLASRQQTVAGVVDHSIERKVSSEELGYVRRLREAVLFTRNHIPGGYVQVRIHDLRKTLSRYVDLERLSEGIGELLHERDACAEVIDQICDAVLGDRRPAWNAAYTYQDGIEAVRSSLGHRSGADNGRK